MYGNIIFKNNKNNKPNFSMKNAITVFIAVTFSHTNTVRDIILKSIKY